MTLLIDSSVKEEMKKERKGKELRVGGGEENEGIKEKRQRSLERWLSG